MKLQQDLKEFIELLNARGVEFVVVGGYAVAFHGHPRFTGDIDVLLAPTPQNAAKVLKVLADFGFAQLDLSIEDFVRPERVVQLGRPPNRIDLLTSISGVEFEEVWADRQSAHLDGVPVSFLGLKCLLLNKRASGRPKDMADLAKLEAIQHVLEVPAQADTD